MKLILCVFATVVLLGACNRIQPVYEVRDQPVFAASRSLSLQQVEDRIALAARTKRWRVYRVEPGQLRAVKRWKRHSATVSIPFSQDVYSIVFHSSDNLLEDEASSKKTVIHRRYNHYVRELAFAINEELSREGTALRQGAAQPDRRAGEPPPWRNTRRPERNLRPRISAPPAEENPRLAALRAATQASTTSMIAAFSRLPDGPLQPEEIRLILAGRDLYNANEEGGFSVTVDRRGILDGVSTQNQADISDSGRWRIDRKGRFCMTWRDRDGGRPTCYRVVKNGKSVRLFDDRGRANYELIL